MLTSNTYTKDFKYFKEKYDESMECMFAAVSDLYAEYWNGFFHFALFKDDHESWESAFLNTHNKYLEALRTSDARNILDLACGRGDFTNVLAENTSGEVLGIDISRSQLSHTHRFKRPNLRFKHYDIMKVDELGEMFDAVMLMDADCYLPDKQLAVEKISKVIKSGARFLLLGWCKQSGLNQIQEELVLYPFMKYWAIPSLETPDNYKKYFEQNNFNIIEITDLNDQVKRNWEFGYESALGGVRTLSRKDLPRLIWKGMKLGSDGIRLIKEQFPAAIYIKVGYDVGFLRYVYFLVEKK
ncbi:class I SAM-dependent methyltransferase [Candidatus Methylomirabilis sp.]|uniref:class I SAM-dependent methyltransferase n=1 Tax=Candidatus Methylomirabilis sp. TaxID=2032687 RepID=UPI003076182E